MTISEKRKVYFRKVHAIQEERGCDFSTAAKLYKQNGTAVPIAKATMSIDDITALAESKVTEITGQLASLSAQISELQNELARWGRLRALVDTASA